MIVTRRAAGILIFGGQRRRAVMRCGQIQSGSVERWRRVGFGLAGGAGAIYARQVEFIEPRSFFINQSFDFLLATVIGGLGTLAGPLLGATTITILADELRFTGDWYRVWFGLFVIVMMLVAPERERVDHDPPPDALRGRAGPTDDDHRTEWRRKVHRVESHLWHGTSAVGGDTVRWREHRGSGPDRSTEPWHQFRSAEPQYLSQHDRAKQPGTEGRQFGDLTLTRERIESVAFEQFPILRQKADDQAGTLSGGEQKMLEVGRAMLLQPRLLLIDEPFIGLPRSSSSRYSDCSSPSVTPGCRS